MQNVKLKIELLLSLFLAPSLLLADVHPASEQRIGLFGDFVYMRRADIHNQTLVREIGGHTLINTKELVNEMGFEPGFRAGLMVNENLKRSYEANALYLRPWHSQEKASGDYTLEFPFHSSDYTEDFYQATRATADYSMHFWDVEVNFWNHFTPRYVDFFSLSGIAGLRYFHWDEGFELTMQKPFSKSDYSIHTKNDIFGLQLGLNFQMNPTQWLTWELMAKVGGMANCAKQKTFLGDRNNEESLRKFQEQVWQIGVFVDVMALVAIHFKERFNVHGGYQMLYFSGLALAPEQISTSVSSNAGKRVNDDGGAIIHGLFVGIGVGF